MIKTTEEIIKSLEICSSERSCLGCAYKGESECGPKMKKDARELICSLMGQNKPASEASQEPVEAPEPWTREKVLDTAKKYICGPREEAYGSPEKGFKLTASLWETYLGSRCVPPSDAICIEPEDVAIMMVLLKISRLAATPDHMDGWIDIAGYAAIGGEIAGKEADQ